MSEQRPSLVELSAGEAREDEREIEKVADRLQNSEPQPAKMHEPAVLPLTASGEEGKARAVLGPDGRPAAIHGEVITTLAAVEARHRELREVKPCISCAHFCFPREGSEENRHIRALVSMGRQWSIIRPAETADEYGQCKWWNQCVHVSQHCRPEWGPDAHSYGKGWLARAKAFMARRFARRQTPTRRS